MNKVIWKFALNIDTGTELPKDAQILSVACQNGEPYIWALVNPAMPMEKRNLKIFATGERFNPDGLTYIGTFHGISGWMVFHLFEEQ